MTRPEPALRPAAPCVDPRRRIAEDRPIMDRAYDEVASRIVSAAKSPESRAATMQRVVDLLWDALHPTGVSWLGFYVHQGGDELLLAARRDKPACSPIALHGACGRAFRTRRPLVVRDVADLGADYIACDPRDRSEVVVPLLDRDGDCWGVLDADSHELAAFSQRDVEGLVRVLAAAGLTATP